MLNGAQVEKVDELLFTGSSIFVFEMDAYPEAKILSPQELQQLYKAYGSWDMVADEVGASEAFVRQNSGQNNTLKIRSKSSKLRHSDR